MATEIINGKKTEIYAHAEAVIDCAVPQSKYRKK